MAALLAQLPAGVIIADRDGNIELANDATRALLADHRIEPVDWIIGRVLLTGEIVRHEEVQYLDKHDEWRTLSVCATPVGETPGRISHALVTFIDITDRNRCREWEPVIRSLSRL